MTGAHDRHVEHSHIEGIPADERQECRFVMTGSRIQGNREKVGAEAGRCCEEHFKGNAFRLHVQWEDNRDNRKYQGRSAGLA